MVVCVYGHPRRLQQLVAAVVCAYIVFRITSVHLPDDEPQDVLTVDDTYPSDMVAAVNPLGGKGDNLHLKLTLNIKSVMKYLDTQEELFAKNEETPDAVRSDIGVVLHDPKRCERTPKVTLLVYVHTEPSRINKRMTQRMTWANERLFRQRDVRVIFVMGLTRNIVLQRQITSEFSRHRDIVQGNFTDDKFSGPSKAVLALTWINKYCANAAYILKVEDDTFVDIFRLREIVKDHARSSRLIICPIWPEHSQLIRRDPRKCSGESWCLRYTEFPGMTHFPSYCDAIGYLMSRAMVARMLSAVPRTPFFWLEEVYMTAILAYRVFDVEYVDLFRNYTTRPIRAYKDTLVLNKRMYVFSKVPYAPNYHAIWEWTLAQLQQGEIDLLSNEMIAHIQNVSKKTKRVHRR